jgi:dTDP-4-dehydrorhamnose 3,5-epimerase
MKFLSTPLRDVRLIEPDTFSDERGHFLRAFCAREFHEAGIRWSVVQANLAGSRHKGTLRGLHYQAAPHEEGKLMRCIKGAIFDLVLDIRPDSDSFGKWYGAELSASNASMLYVPPGCAHGYLTLEDDTEVYYLVSEYYESEAERGIRWNDPQFSIDWPQKENLVLSEKDRSWPDYIA